MRIHEFCSASFFEKENKERSIEMTEEETSNFIQGIYNIAQYNYGPTKVIDIHTLLMTGINAQPS